MFFCKRAFYSATALSIVIPENAFSQENILLSSFWVLKTYLKTLAKRLDTLR